MPVAENPRGENPDEDVDPVAVTEVANWLNQLIRTLKTCRLYDSNNPTVVRFREGVGVALTSLLERHGEIVLDVSTHALHYCGKPVFSPTSREDNLAAAFHRDGIRSLTLMPGIEVREVESFLDHLLLVTGRSGSDDDLVTLLWEANLPSIGVKAVPIEGDIDGAGEEDASDEESTMPWPQPGATAAAPAPTQGSDEQTADPETRSDDWTAAERPADLEAAYKELIGHAQKEVARFQSEHEAEENGDLLVLLSDVMHDCLATDTSEDDRREFARFLPRLLRESFGAGDWRIAHRTLEQLKVCNPGWSSEGFFEGLTGSSRIVTVQAVTALDRQDDEEIEAFLSLAREFGAASAEWLMQVLAESQQKRTRRPLARVIADLVKDQPERVLPWMSDERWYVVRNVVHILGWIGGDSIVGHLKSAADHPEARVRREVVAAVSEVAAAVARPLLLEMLPLAEPRLFAAILHQLSLDGAIEVSTRLVELLEDKVFDDRSEEEQRAVYMALATRGNEVLVPLEEQFKKGGLFVRGMDAHWQAVARCISRIGTAEAVEILERGARSKRGGVRKACEVAMAAVEGLSDAA